MAEPSLQVLIFSYLKKTVSAMLSTVGEILPVDSIGMYVQAESSFTFNSEYINGGRDAVFN